MRKEELLKEKLGPYKQINKEFFYSCPNIACSSHKKNKFKLSVNFEKSLYHCWVCEISGSIKKLVNRFKSDKFFLEKWSKVDTTYSFSEFDSLFEKFEPQEIKREAKLPHDFTSIINNNSIISNTVRNYLFSRNLSVTDLLYWKPGYSLDNKYKDRVIFPSFDNEGKINYFQARTILEDEKISYIKADINSKDIIFNELYIDWEKPVVLVEGIFDAIVGGYNTIPTLGSNFNEGHKLFREIVRNQSIVYLALDPDAQEKEYKIAEKLHKYGIIVYKIIVEPYKDVGEMTKKEFLSRKKSAKILKETLFIDKLQYTLKDKLGINA
jgi:DNA primase